MWLLKPTGLNRGKGIHVVSGFKKVKRLIKEYCIGRPLDGSDGKPPLQPPIDLIYSGGDPHHGVRSSGGGPSSHVYKNNTFVI